MVQPCLKQVISKRERRADGQPAKRADGMTLFFMELDKSKIEVREIDLDVSDDELLQISRDGMLALKPANLSYAQAAAVPEPVAVPPAVVLELVT